MTPVRSDRLDEMPAEEELTVREHLYELKATFTRIVVPFIVLFILFFGLAEPLTRMLISYMELEPSTIVALSPLESLQARSAIASSLALFLSLPLVFLAIYSFVKPVFSRRHHRTLVRIALISMLLSVIGALTGVLLFARVILYTLSTVYALVDPMWSISSVVSLVLTLAITTAIFMQVALIIPLLVRYDIISLGTLRASRGNILIAIAILSAFLTPPDPISMIVMSAPLYLSFEAGLLASIPLNRQVKKP